MTDNDDTLKFTPIFVGGAMRTGTSLLQNILCTAPSANDMMLECQYLTEQLSLHVHSHQKSDRALEDFFDGKDALTSFSKKIVYDFLRQTYIQQGSPKHLILKHPEMTVFFPLLADFLPEARFIVSARDPKDVVTSMLVVAEKQKKSGRTSNMVQADRDMSRLTHLFLSFYRGLGDTPEGRIKYIKYEDLVTKTPLLLPELSAFLGLDLSGYDPQAIWKYTRPVKYNEAFNTKIRGKSLSNSSIGNYKDKLSKEEITVIEQIAGDFMTFFRYPAQSRI